MSKKLLPTPVPPDDPKEARLTFEHIDLESLTQREFDAVYDEMSGVISDAAAALGDRAWADDYWVGRRNKARTDTHAYLARDRGYLVGFAFFSVFPVGSKLCLNLQSGFIRPDYQRGGLGFRITARVLYRTFLLRPWGEFLLSFELINPVVLSGWLRRLPRGTRTYPEVFGLHSDELDRLAPDLASRLFPDNEFDAETGVLTGRTIARPRGVDFSGNDIVDEYLALNMDSGTGDSILFIADLDRPAIRRGLMELIRSTGRVLSRRLRRPSGSATGHAGNRVSVG